MRKKIEIEKPVKEKPCYKKDSFHTLLCRDCKVSNFFLGATRTYSYIAGLPISNSWHYQNPTYGQIVLSRRTSDGDRPQSSFNATPYYTVYGSPSRVDQGCLAYYARYNAVLYGIVITPPDQTKLGRYGKLMQDYYHFVETKKINDFNQRQVKWINGYMFKYLLTPISLSFWIGGCGLPCWECAYSGILCEGGPEGTLLGIILGLDRYWITQHADNQRLWPNTEYYLVDYYGVTIRGPEPKIGWLFYIMFRKEVCSYCHCVLFCFQVQCADPWKVWYQVSTSIITYETGPYGSESIPHRKADKFIEFYNTSKIDISKHKIELDNVANDEVFIRGTMDYHTAKISTDKPAIYTVSKLNYELNKSKDAEVYGGGIGEE